MRRNMAMFIVALLIVLSAPVSAQQFTVKSNLLYDLTSTLNLGGEVGLSSRWTVDLSANYNPWNFSGNRKMKHWMIQPEARYWMNRSFVGHFFGAHLVGGGYNFGGMLPFGIKPSKSGLGDNRYQGWMAGAGFSYGYSWLLNDRWGLEASLGLGFLRFGYDRYDCKTCGEKLGSEKNNYWGPTKAAVSLIYIIK